MGLIITGTVCFLVKLFVTEIVRSFVCLLVVDLLVLLVGLFAGVELHQKRIIFVRFTTKGLSICHSCLERTIIILVTNKKGSIYRKVARHISFSLWILLIITKHYQYQSFIESRLQRGPRLSEVSRPFV